MTFNEYQKAALRTANGANGVNITNGALGLCGEAGEVADQIKKSLYQGHPLDPDHIAEELGDIAWYIAITAEAIGYDLEDIILMNVEKLKKRYPDGFSAERSQHRSES